MEKPADRKNVKRIAVSVEHVRGWGRRVCEGIASFARTRPDWSLTMFEDGLPDKKTLSRFDGFLWCVADERMALALKETGRPVVSLFDERAGRAMGFAHVGSDHDACGELAARTFISHQFKNFTSIGCGSVAEAGPCYRVFKYDNGGAPYDPRYRQQRMLCPPQVGNDGRCCVLFEVYADHLVMKVRSLAFDCPLCEDRAIALPPIPGGEYDFTRRAEIRPAPQFPSDTKATVEFAVNPQYCGPGLKGKPCAVVKFPCARPQEGGGKVFDYMINAFVDGRQVLRTYILNRGYYLPGDRSFTEGVSILGRHELPKGKEVVFSITPRDCYRVCGDELLTAPVVVNP